MKCPHCNLEHFKYVVGIKSLSNRTKHRAKRMDFHMRCANCGFESDYK